MTTRKILVSHTVTGFRYANSDLVLRGPSFFLFICLFAVLHIFWFCHTEFWIFHCQEEPETSWKEYCVYWCQNFNLFLDFRRTKTVQLAIFFHPHSDSPITRLYFVPWIFFQTMSCYVCSTIFSQLLSIQLPLLILLDTLVSLSSVSQMS